MNNNLIFYDQKSEEFGHCALDKQGSIVQCGLSTHQALGRLAALDLSMKDKFVFALLTSGNINRCKLSPNSSVSNCIYIGIPDANN